jgi:RNA polymerase sigma factor (sigma-70 family)
LTPADVKWARDRGRSLARLHGHLSEDLQSEAVLALVEASAKFRPSEAGLNVRSYAWGPITKAVFTYLRHWYGRRVVGYATEPFDPAIFDELPTATTAYNNVDPDRWHAWLEWKLAQLPRREHRILRRYLVEGQEIKAIAAAFRLHSSRVTQIIHTSTELLFGLTLTRTPPSRTPEILARRRASPWRARTRSAKYKRRAR